MSFTGHLRFTPRLLFAFALLSPFLSAPGEPDSSVQTQEASAQPSSQTSATQQLWDRVCTATLLRSKQKTKPITALDLRLGVLTRGANGSNEIRPRVRWMAPNFIRIQLSSGVEQARGAEGDWLAEGEEVVRLVGREYSEDRRLTDEYLTLIQNFVALTHPTSMKVENMEIVTKLPFEFPKRHELDRARDRKKITWLRFESADLQLAGVEARGGAPLPKQRVYVAVNTTHDLPIMAYVESGDGQAAPLLLSLSKTSLLGDLRVPHEIHVYPVLPGGPSSQNRTLIGAAPSQQLNIHSGTIRARLSAKDFQIPK